jgi:TolB protein
MRKGQIVLRGRMTGAILDAMAKIATRWLRTLLAIFSVVVIAISVSTILFAASRDASAASIAGTITFVGTDANIYYCDANCPEPKCVTCKTTATHVRREGGFVPVVAQLAQGPEERRPSDAEYGWPTFSRDGKRIAYVSESHKGGADSFAVWVFDIAQHRAMQIFESRSERIIYVTWLPDGEHISFLLAEPNGLSLLLAELKESAPVRIVTTGMPLYFDWSTTPGLLVVHLLALNTDRTEQVALMNLTPTSQNVKKMLSSGRTPFKTPCWSPDGKHLAYIANNHAESNIIVADADAKNPHSVVSLPVGENALVWAPDSAHLAYSTAITAQNPIFHGIKLVDIKDASSKWLTKSDIAAFFFAPDSKHLVYVAAPEDKSYYTWFVVDVRTGMEKAIGNFLTTTEESTAYRYFDQLAVSHTIFSPDSQAFVYAGARLVGEPERASGISSPPVAWIVPIDGSAPHQIANAVLAFFSPASSK